MCYLLTCKTCHAQQGHLAGSAPGLCELSVRGSNTQQLLPDGENFQQDITPSFDAKLPDNRWEGGARLAWQYFCRPATSEMSQCFFRHPDALLILLIDIKETIFLTLRRENISDSVLKFQHRSINRCFKFPNQMCTQILHRTTIQTQIWTCPCV